MDLLGKAYDPFTTCVRIKKAALALAWGKDREAYNTLMRWTFTGTAGERLSEAEMINIAFGAPVNEYFVDALGDEIRRAMQANIDRKREGGDLISRTLGN